MRLALGQFGLMVSVEVLVPICLPAVVAGISEADLVVNDAVPVELKSWEEFIREPESQTTDCRRVTPPAAGLRMNFGLMPDLLWMTALSKAYLKWQNR
jgi:hypothetical protein